MNPRDTIHATAHPGPRRRGFSFVELMFAVIVLGIGLIMTAALFPVGIRQAKTASESTAGGVAARAAKDLAANLAADRPGTFSGVAIPFTLPPTDFANPTLGLRTDQRTHIGTEGQGYGEGGPANPNPVGDADSYVGPNAGGAAPLVANEVLHLPGTFVGFGDARFNSRTASPYGFDWESITRDKVRGQSIVATDPRYGLIPLYARGRTYVNQTASGTDTRNVNGVYSKADATAQFVVVVVQSRIRDQYGQADLNGVTFTPVPVFVRLNEGDDTLEPFTPDSDSVDRVRFENVGGSPLTHAEVPAAAEGAFVVIADDRQGNDLAGSARDESRGASNGRVYRLGRQVGRADQPAIWELAPGFDMRYQEQGGGASAIGEQLPPPGVTGTNDAPAFAYLVGGRQPEYDESGNVTGFRGPAQAVAVYTSVVPVQ